MRHFKELHIYIEESSAMVKKTVVDENEKIVFQTYHPATITPSPSPIDIFEAALNGAQVAILHYQNDIIQELRE